MHPVRRILAIAAILLSLSVNETLAAEGETWFEARTANFLLYTNTNRERATELITDLERFRHTIGLLVGLDLSASTFAPLTVYAYDRQRDYERRHDMAGTGGFYSVYPEGPVAVLSLEDGDKAWQLKGRQVLYHEYTHHILHQYSPYDYPRWYDEGFAEFLSTMDFDGDTAQIGDPPLHRLPALKKAGDWLTIKELLESKGRYIGYMGSGLTRDPDRYRVGLPHQYAQGWLVTHFLHNSERFRAGLAPYIVALNQPGIDERDAFEEAFGVTYYEMDTAVREYWYDYQLPLQALDLSNSMPGISIDMREMHALEAVAVDYEGRLRTGQLDGDEDEATAAFRDALDAGIRERDMQEYLARIALGEKDWASARKWIDAMLAAEPKNAAGLTLMARLLRAENGEDLSQKEKITAVRNYCLRAIRAEPTYVPALIAYAELALVKEQPVNSLVLKIVESIRFLAPDLDSGRVLEARLLAKAGRIDEAREAVQKLIEWSASRSEQGRFEDLLEDIEEGAAMED